MEARIKELEQQVTVAKRGPSSAQEETKQLREELEEKKKKSQAIILAEVHPSGGCQTGAPLREVAWAAREAQAIMKISKFQHRLQLFSSKAKHVEEIL